MDADTDKLAERRCGDDNAGGFFSLLLQKWDVGSVNADCRRRPRLPPRHRPDG